MPMGRDIKTQKRRDIEFDLYKWSFGISLEKYSLILIEPLNYLLKIGDRG